ncbi:MAG: cobyrinate a,c-diamide synthase [Desulfobacteraceae bacterium]|nr:cobyrinate a,c-diamide synthase [Desulfobacteraceae bacterium]
MEAEPIAIPRVLIAGMSGGSGKTVVSIGIVSALAGLGKNAAPFKKGPDYIDAGWLAMAAGRPCYNLDSFLFSTDSVCLSFLKFSRDADLSVIEGNRGLYDGLDADGTTSTASLAKTLGAPVILCLDCTKTTRTMAAVVLGCLHFDQDVNICGVILNRVAGSRHERILRTSIESHCGVPVLGAVPKLSQEGIPERHMGLIPTPEHKLAANAIDSAARITRSHIDLDRLMQFATKPASNPLCPESSPTLVPPPGPAGFSKAEYGGSEARVRIGVLRDSAFQFYYPENLEALEAGGAELTIISPLTDTVLPHVDALYIGGGFPETHARRLAENLRFRNALKNAADGGLPIYAECGGLMYLGESLVLDNTYPMAGVLPVVFGFSRRPQGHGYTIVSVEGENPYFRTGMELRGHEFHYSRVLEWKGKESDLLFSMKKGRGMVNRRDGLLYKNVLATYTHIHALGAPDWAGSLVRAAEKYKHTGS